MSESRASATESRVLPDVTAGNDAPAGRSAAQPVERTTERVGLLRGALLDIREGLKRRRMWTALAAEDVTDAHRRTLLGPLWLLLNYLLLTGTFVIVFGRGRGLENYTAYVSVGLLVFLLISEAITQSTTLFVRESSFIQGTVLPLSVYVLRQSMQSLIRTCYTLVGCIPFLLMSDVGISLAWIGSLLGLLLVIATVPAASLVFAVLGVLLPDTRYIMGNVMRLGMFLTPIFWTAEGSSGLRAALYHWNPFTYYLEIVRIPILTGELPLRAWVLCAAMSLGLWILAVLALGKYRKQIVFML